MRLTQAMLCLMLVAGPTAVCAQEKGTPKAKGIAQKQEQKGKKGDKIDPKTHKGGKPAEDPAKQSKAAK